MLQLTPTAFRQRLSRARRAVVSFTRARCGLVNPDAACRCRRRVGHALSTGRINPAQLEFASDAERARRFPAVLEGVRQLEAIRRTAALYRSHPDFAAPAHLVAGIRRLLAGAP